MRISLAHARSLGIVIPPETKAKAKATEVLGPDGRKATKLELAFWDRAELAKRAGVFGELYREPFKLRVVADRYYIPDFVTVPNGPGRTLTIWEVKGFMRDDAAIKLLAAAERYPCFGWVLVQRDRGTWRCTDVTARGFAKESWCPDWLI